MQLAKYIAPLLVLFPLSLFSKTIPETTAQIESPNLKLASNWYAGVGAGAMINQYNINSTTSTQFPSSAFFSQSQSDADTFGSTAQGSLFFGYLYAWNTHLLSLYIGPEIYASLSNPTFSAYQSANATLPTESLNTITKGHLNSIEGDIDLRVGHLIAPGTLLFGRVGAAFNTISLDTTSTISRPALPLTSTVTNTYSKFNTGLRIGGGVEQEILPKLNVRADYIFTHYPSINFSATRLNNPADTFQLAPISNTTSMKLNTNTILFSIIYKGIDFT